MPIVIPKDIPAFDILKKENIFVMNETRASTQDIRPIEIAILNLMPTKEVTETQLMRLLGNTPLQVNITLIRTESYLSKNATKLHLDKFYKTFSEIKERKFDGMIITGAPVEKMEYDEVAYWKELCEIFDYTDKNVTSTVFICWGAQAAMKHFYGISKRELKKKVFGVFANKATSKNEPLLKGMNDVFFIPHSRHTTIDKVGVRREKELKVLAEGKECGISIVKSVDDRRFFFFGHTEYDRETLKKEYLRDLEKGEEIERPKHYFVSDEGTEINMTWSSTGNLLFYNWLNHYVYQVTPFSFD